MGSEDGRRITVSLNEELYESIRKYAYMESCSLSEAVRKLCISCLVNDGYGFVAENEFFRKVEK